MPLPTSNGVPKTIIVNPPAVNTPTNFIMSVIYDQDGVISLQFMHTPPNGEISRSVPIPALLLPPAMLTGLQNFVVNLMPFEQRFPLSRE